MELKEISAIKYCLYARKSSESDERQAMSIDSQIKEMLDLAERSNLEIVEVKKESHSAKNSGTRPLFLEMIYELNQGSYDGILTWAPDRLSRNAGDLGSLVDMMDKGKLVNIKTSSQSFSNNPNEKFLLMILCSQAKLENDNRGLNVKRGIRAKCEMGWRPAPAPIGYLNYSHAGVKKVMQDPDSAHIVKEMFTLVANSGYSGRKIKNWSDNDVKLRSQTGKKLSLSMIYRMLKNSFYYGEFEYPVDSGKWYRGAHEPLITKEIYEKVQKQLFDSSSYRGQTKWGSKTFDFKDVFKCAYCGGTVIGEEKFKKLKSGKKNKHVYYHCTKNIDPNCPEPYVNKKDLVPNFISFIELLEKKNKKVFKIDTSISNKIEKYRAFRDQILQNQNIDDTEKELNFSEYFKHIINNGSLEEKKETLECIKTTLYIHNGVVLSNPLI